MLTIVPYQLDTIKEDLKTKAVELGYSDAIQEGSNISQLINLLSYATLYPNLNFTFGLNEMFLTQATDRANVLKHARDKGYISKRMQSYQYKIKLLTNKYGEITLNKYQQFSSNGNNYIYMGDSITNVYGNYAYIKLLSNEFNNSLDNTYIDNILEESNIVTEDGQVCYIYSKEIGTSNKLLIKTLDDEDLPIFSTLPKEIYTHDGTYSGGYRNLQKVGEIDSYITSTDGNEFKIQITTDTPGDFPIFTEVIENKALNQNGSIFKFDTDVANPIKYIKSIVVDSSSESIDLLSVEYNEGDYNASIPTGQLSIIENHPNTDISTDVDFNANIDTTHNIIELTGVQLVKGSNNIDISTNDLSFIGNTISILQQSYQDTESKIVSGSTIQLTQDNIDIVLYVIIRSTSSTLISNFSWTTDGVITILDEFNAPDTQYDGLNVDIDFKYIEDYTNVDDINISYTYNNNTLAGEPITVTYEYDIGGDGFLDKKFFFSDLRGEYLDNETNWEGFYANSFDPETSILTFDISGTNNLYVSIENNGIFEDPLQLNEAIESPYRRTRFSNGVVFDESTCFASINNTELKNTIEIVVKEGELRRYSDVDDLSEPLYPNQTFIINNDMEDSGYFMIDADTIENNGIEMFVTRTIDDGSLVTDEVWTKRELLLPEKKLEEDKTFIILSDLNYENYVNIYTRYAGTGTALGLGSTIKLNMIYSSGSNGFTNDIIEPIDNTDFIGTMYDEDLNIPNIVYIEGSDKESTQDIKDNALLFNNTASRAVTKNDYLTIVNSQPFIGDTEIWGGEDIVPTPVPGHIYITAIPTSKPSDFVLINNEYILTSTNTDLFYPTYYQITGKDSYIDYDASTEAEVLFNIIDKYKVMTLQLDYVKTIYLDFKLDIRILKKTFFKSTEEINDEMFNKIKDYFYTNIETYNSNFFNSTTTKYIDSVLGDDFGFEMNVDFSVELFDYIDDPDRGVFTNYSMNYLDDTPYNGYKDTFVFEMPISLPLDGLFEDNIIELDGSITYGNLIYENLTNINTNDFLKVNDRIYVGGLETSNYNPISNSSYIKLPIMYTENRNSIVEEFVVGEYNIYPKKKIIILKIFVDKYLNQDNYEQRYLVSSGDLVLEDPILKNGYVNNFGEWIRFDIGGVPDEVGDYSDNVGTPLDDWIPRRLIDIELSTNLLDGSFNTSVLDSYKTNEYFTTPIPFGYINQEKYDIDPLDITIEYVRELPLPRDSFMSSKELSINPKGDNIESLRNVFNRLREVRFI